MKKRTLFLSIPLILSALGAITSCGESSVSSVTSSATSNAPDTSETVAFDPASLHAEITLWSITGQNNQAQLQSYCDSFMEKYPNVKINNVIQSGMGYNELKEAVVKGFSANNYPDIVQCYPDHVAEYIDYGKSVDLSSYISDPVHGWTAEEKADYIDTFLQEGDEYTIDGTYSVPYCKSTELMFWNEDVLKGLDLSSVDATINAGAPLNQAYFDNLTWEELFGKLCPAIISYNNSLPENQKILKSDQDYHSVFAYDSDDNLFITLAKQYGYGYTGINKATGKGTIDFNNDGMKSLMKTFNDAAKKGYIMSKGSAGGNYTNSYFTAQNALFSVGSTGGVKYQFSSTNPMNVGVARIPHAAGKDPFVINQGPSLTVLDHNDDDRALASWLFYKHMTNEENSLDWAINSGYMGIRHSNYEDEDYKDATNPDGKPAKSLERLMAKSADYTKNITGEMYTSPAFKGSSTARTQAGGLMTSCLTETNLTDAKLNELFEKAVSECLLAL